VSSSVIVAARAPPSFAHDEHPMRQRGESLEDTHLGDLFGYVPQTQLADQLHVRARRRQLTRVAAVLVMVAGDPGGIERAVVARRPSCADAGTASATIAPTAATATRCSTHEVARDAGLIAPSIPLALVNLPPVCVAHRTPCRLPRSPTACR
jgi:hypothetical protein